MLGAAGLEVDELFADHFNGGFVNRFSETACEAAGGDLKQGPGSSERPGQVYVALNRKAFFRVRDNRRDTHPFELTYQGENRFRSDGFGQFEANVTACVV